MESAWMVQVDGSAVAAAMVVCDGAAALRDGAPEDCAGRRQGKLMKQAMNSVMAVNLDLLCSGIVTILQSAGGRIYTLLFTYINLAVSRNFPKLLYDLILYEKFC